MIFTETDLSGAFIIEMERLEDQRGFFARSFCQDEFQAHGLDARIVQCNISFNLKKGTLRGMHWQAPPHEEAKTIRCIKGALYDVIIDLRLDSTTYKQWVAKELSEDNRTMLHVPRGFAHGFLTLSDNTEILYLMSTFYNPASARGARFDDPVFNIDWPVPIKEISHRDRTYPDFTPTLHAC